MGKLTRERPPGEVNGLIGDTLHRKWCFTYQLGEEQRGKHTIWEGEIASLQLKVRKDFVNLRNKGEAGTPGRWWKRWSVVPANSGGWEPDHPRPRRPQELHFILMTCTSHWVLGRGVA